jgi:hypothetical protein
LGYNGHGSLVWLVLKQLRNDPRVFKRVLGRLLKQANNDAPVFKRVGRFGVVYRNIWNNAPLSWLAREGGSEDPEPDLKDLMMWKKDQVITIV